MKRIAYLLIAMATMVFTFTSCEDVPSPFGQPTKPVEPGTEVVDVDPAGSGTEADPYNVAAALQVATAMSGDDAAVEIVAQGYITSIDDMSTSYGNCTYNISDDADGKANKLMVYRGYGLNGDKFVTGSEIKEGDFVVIKGGIVNYKGNTPEFTTGSAILSINGQGGGDKPDTPTETLGTVDEPISVAKALEVTGALEDNAETGEAYVKGIISKVQSYSEKYLSITYYISDNGKEDNQLQIYSGKNIDGADFKAATDLSTGDEVIVKGKLKKYVNDKGTTLEMNQPNQIISIKKGGDTPDTPTFTGSGTATDPYTTADALSIISTLAPGTTSDSEVYTKGKIVSISEIDTGTYGNATYMISDDGTTNKQLTVFRGYSLENEKFTSTNEIKVGDEVVIYGKLQNYQDKNGNLTPEIAQRNYIYSLNGKTENSDDSSDGYVKVTSIEAGTYIIAANTEGANYVVATPIAADKSYGYLYTDDATESNNTINTDADNEFTIKAVSGGYTIQSPDGRYLYMKDTYNSFNVDINAPSEGHVWTITFNNDKTVNIKNVLTGKTIQYSSQYSSYGSYTDITNTLPCLYKK